MKKITPKKQATKPPSKPKDVKQQSKQPGKPLIKAEVTQKKKPTPPPEKTDPKKQGKPVAVNTPRADVKTGKKSQKDVRFPKDEVPKYSPPYKMDEEFPVELLTEEIGKNHPSLKGKVNAISITKPESKFRVEITVRKGEDPVKIKQEVSSKLGINIGDIDIKESNPLKMFNPLVPVCAKGYQNNEFVQGGSCGLFLKEGTKQRVMSAAHVFEGNVNIRIAPYLHMDGVKATVRYTDMSPAEDPDSADIGVADLTIPSSWHLDPTSIAQPKVKMQVKHCGGASVTQYGTIVSKKASAQFNGVVYHNLIELNIYAQHGDSGSPVVDENNNIIGLIIGGDAQSNQIYCSNLSRAKGRVGTYLSTSNLFLHTAPIRHERSLTDTGGYTSENGNSDPIRLREVEIWMKEGELVRAATVNEYGMIKMSVAGANANEYIQVLTHYKHSFEDKDRNNQPVGKKVWFFAVPLEYIVKIDEMGGTVNESPLVAVNISTVRKSLKPQSGRYKLTPCGTGSTVQPPPVGSTPPPPGGLAMQRVAKAAIFKPGAKLLPSRRANLPAKPGANAAKKKAQKGVVTSFVINDYGHLVIVEAPKKILPWEKVIAGGTIHFRNTRLNTQHPSRMRMCYNSHQRDLEWKWQP